MTFLITYIITIIIAICVIVINFKHNLKNINLIKLNLQECKQKEKEAWDRVKELEDGIEKEYGVSIRQEITKVECVFNKSEMVFIMSGIHKILDSPGTSIEDKEAIIALYKKIQSVISQMEENGNG